MRIEKSYNESNELIFPYPFDRVGIEINQKCNLHCKYCWNQKWNNKEINIQNLKKILNSIYLSSLKWKQQKPIQITFYAAEPLLSPSLLKEIINWNYPFCYSILTNGIVLYENNLVDFLYNKEVSLLFSLDGIKKNHEKYRGKNFNKLISNILNYPSYNKISTNMTVNVDSLPYLYDSLVFMNKLPVGNYECHLNLHDNWNDTLFMGYIEIISKFIQDYKDINTLPNYKLENRFSNYGNSQKYLKDSGGPLLQIDVDCNIMIQKPHRSCLNLPDKKDLFYGKVFANHNGFLSSSLKKEYYNFMEKGYYNYNYISDNCNQCKYNYICSNNREKEVYLYPKECYPILETFILQERFWNNELL